MTDSADQNPPPAPPLPRVLLVVDDESLARFGAVCKHIVVGLADVVSRVVALAMTRHQPGPLALGPCEVVHSPPRQWPFRATVPEEVEDLADENRLDAVLCLSAELLRWAASQTCLRTLPIAAYLTDHADLATWNATQTLRPRLFGLPATPTLFQRALQSKRVPVQNLKLVRLGVLGHANNTIRLDDPEHLPSAMIMSPLTAESGIEHVLQAMARVIAATGRDVAMFVLGAGPFEHRIRQLAKALGIRASVTFVGELQQWEEALLGCDMLVLARKPERWSSLVLQAMADGRVILAPQDCGEDYLVAGQTACLYEPNNVNSLAGEWESLLTQAGKVDEIAAAARKFIKANHGISAMADALAGVFAEMAGKAAPAT